MSDFRQLRIANERRDKEWNPCGLLDLSFRGNELAGELGEACNKLKKLERERLGLNGSRATVEEVAEELADIVICTDLIAMDLRINLLQAVEHKFNKTSEERGLSIKMESQQNATPTLEQFRPMKPGWYWLWEERWLEGSPQAVFVRVYGGRLCIDNSPIPEGAWWAGPIPAPASPKEE